MTLPPKAVLRDVAGLFFRLGTLGFGGPAAHIALMHREAVTKRGWLSEESFLDMVGAVNLLPGPSSTQLAIFLGMRRAGWVGLLLGGLCFVLPATLITLAVAMAYEHYGSLPQATSLLRGVRPVVIVIILDALRTLGQPVVRRPLFAVLGAGSALLAAAGVNPLLCLVTCGLIGVGWAWMSAKRGSTTAVALEPVTLWGLFLVFLKIGAVVFGSGYVLLAFLRADLIYRLHWLTEPQLLDAVAAGNITPGPVFTTATFIGYMLGGVKGAAVATAAVFLPSFALIAVGGWLLDRLRESELAARFLDGINAGAVGLIAAVCWQLGRATLVDPFSWTILGIASVLLLRFQISPLWVVGVGALAGLASPLAGF